MKTQLNCTFIARIFFYCLAFLSNSLSGSAQQRPNIIILFADDMGYGDLQCYGNPTIKTPHLDALAAEGIRFTSYTASAWCTPSRAELMTGRYSKRIDWNENAGSGGKDGLPDSELTLAEGLRRAGYATGMAGKWHLGYYQKKFLPTNKGFDSWLGLPYSNDYKKPYVNTDVPLVMYRDTTVVEYPVNQDSMMIKYTSEAIRYIKKNSAAGKPFFFYLAYQMPHLPLHPPKAFLGKSGAGLYGDVIEALDWSVGKILQTLKEQGIEQNTIVFFASDNGPWQHAPDRMFQQPQEPEGSDWERHNQLYGTGNKPWDAGSAGPLKGYKATTYEGGPRVPAMIRWPGHIKAGQTSDEMVSNLDIFTTFLHAGGGQRPDHTTDGLDMMPFFTGKEKHSPRNEFAYFLWGKLEAMRLGDWKLRTVNGIEELFNLQTDPGEKYNRAEEHPEIVKEIKLKMQTLANETHAKIDFTEIKK
ncbi:MAG TPA: sulfatase [Agriterribacter sp.]|nr:sulfatase [Agriterribacter sp.]